MKISKALLKEIIEEEIKSLMEEEDKTTAEDELEKIASDYVDLYKSIHNFKPDVLDTDTIEDLKKKITDLEDADAAAAFEKLVDYAKKTPPSSNDPKAMKTGVVEGE